MQNLTPALSAVGIYAALNMALLIWIAMATSRLRVKYKVSIGDGDIKHLTRIIRGHANAIENMPIFLIMLVVALHTGRCSQLAARRRVRTDNPASTNSACRAGRARFVDDGGVITVVMTLASFLPTPSS